MAKGLLASYAGYPYTISSLMPDNGLASLAGVLTAGGHDVKVLDYGTVGLVERLVPKELVQRMKETYDAQIDPTYQLSEEDKKFYDQWESHQKEEAKVIAEEFSEMVGRENPDFVGFKLWHGDGFEGSIEMAKVLRRDHPDVKLYAGGPHAYIFKSRLLHHIDVDALVYEEAEDTILDLAEHSIGKRKISDIPNLLYMENGNIRSTQSKKLEGLDRLAFPIYDERIYPSLEGNQKANVFIVDESRGCVQFCPFCPQSAREGGNKFRIKNPERVVDEMQRLYEERGVRIFRFGGQMTTGPQLEKISKEILRRNMKIDFSVFGYANALRGTDFPLLRKAGLRAVFYGNETGDQELLRNFYGKDVKVKDVADVMKETKKAGIKVVGSFIYPALGETPESRENTLEFIADTRPDSVLIYPPGLYPNTTWARNPQKFGFELGMTKEDYEDMAIQYKIKNVHPPQLMDLLPYTVGGKSFGQLVMECSSLTEDVGKMGITLHMSDEHFLMADAIGEDPQKLSGDMRKMFWVGDVDKIKDLVGRINQNGKG